MAVTLQNLYWWCFSWYVLPHIPVTVIVTWTVWWCMVVAVVLVVEVVVVVALVGVVLVALAHMLETHFATCTVWWWWWWWCIYSTNTLPALGVVTLGNLHW